MTRKDYQLIADILAQHNREANERGRQFEAGAVAGVAYELATKLQADNPRFNRDTFLGACGL